MSKITNKYDFLNYLDKYYIDDISKIELIGVIKITNDFFNNIDNIILKYYGDIDFLPLILIFNNISDLTNIPVGTNFKLPNIDAIINNIYIIDDSENLYGLGIVPNISNNLSNLKNIKKSNYSEASPKLNISMKKVNYDLETGIITF